MLREIDRRIFLRHGGKRAWLRTVAGRFAHAAGRYAGQEALDWPEVKRLVFVCSGNICRSAYGEARARSLGLPAASFGLAADPRSGADARAQAVAARRGIDLSAHRARGLAELPLLATDLVLLFEPRHVGVLETRLADAPPVRLRLLGLWSRPACPYIHDPYGLDECYFDVCFARIDSAVARLAEQLSTSGRE